jgi:3-phenylpropionate/cinnamic acid dioxygenase small subunit
VGAVAERLSMTTHYADRAPAEASTGQADHNDRIERPRELVEWDVERQIVDFLVEEAQVLDEMRFDDWLSMLAPDIQYRVPVRATRPPRQESEFSDSMFHFDDDIALLRLRVARLKTGDAWAEVPPSRTRHFLSNFRVFRETDRPGHYRVSSNLLLIRSRGDEPQQHILGGSRQDVVRCRESGAYELVERTVLLDATTLPTYNLAFFF